MQTNAVAAINRSEVMVQLDAAHHYPRTIRRFMQTAIKLATVNVKTAESCIYALPRGGKTISGPSVRLAEICASAYGNLHVGARVLDAGDREVVAQGVAWDLETNLRVTIEVPRRITDKNGNRFNDDMIAVTGAAARSIAFRNAIFSVVPRTYIMQVYDRCKAVAIGKAETFTARRDEILARLAKMGADGPRVFNALKVRGTEDITVEHLETLIGYGTAIKQEDKTVDELFPAPVSDVPGADQPGRKLSLKKEEPAPPPAAMANEQKPETPKSPEDAKSAMSFKLR
jgi:hypothetical protein